MGEIPVRPEDSEKKFHGGAGIPLSLPEGTAGAGHRGIPYHYYRPSAFYPGAYRHRKDHGRPVSCRPCSGTGIRRQDFLSDGQDYYQDSGPGGFRPSKGDGAVL